MEKPLLEVKNLTTRFKTVKHTLTAVDKISFTVAAGEILAIVGESGCGKSVTALSLMKLIEPPGMYAPEAEVLFEGKNLLVLDENAISQVRGNEIAMIFQEPAASFNLLFKIGEQIGESLIIHKGYDKNKAMAEAVNLLEKVRIPEPAKRIHDYPFQLSGGMLQRVMIALALSCAPRLLIADEPTTALDVTIQAQILKLLKESAVQNNMAVLFITHDLTLIEGFAQRVMIMYAGRILEQCAVADIHKSALHPYTKDLLRSIPRMGYFKDTHALFSIKGSVPELYNLPAGCKYAPRCEECFERCLQEEPPLIALNGHNVRCWLYAKEKK
jgi:peptide/nickel transport system ATP-binding protein